MTEIPNYTLDITDQLCPMTFVRVKLLIERMGCGDVAEIRLQGREPVENVPKSVMELGHEIISVCCEDLSIPWGVHRIVLRKK